MNFHLIKRPLVSLRPEEQAPMTNYAESVETHRAVLLKAMETYPSIRYILRDAQGETMDDMCEWLYANKAIFSPDTYFADSQDLDSVLQLKSRHPKVIGFKGDLSRVRHLNTLLNHANEVLADEGIMVCHSRTSGYQAEQIRRAHPGLYGRILCNLHFYWHRVIARLKLTRWFYMAVTKGKNRSFPRVEILGRICRAGFDVIYERFYAGEFFVLAQKQRAPIWDDDPTNGILVKLPRVGYKGKMIGVYKVRTMYPYSEYLQPYMYETHGLGEEGKFDNDFRVNHLGKRIRGTWLDEFPMIINFIKGQMKLVGVRPLSRHYLSLYTPEMQELHISVKPGLMPPFYYEETTPQTIEEVQDSERRYIEAYKKHPLRTDWHYFWRILANILFKHKRSR